MSLPGNSLSFPITARHLLVTRIIFLLAGTSYSAWAPLVPFAKQRLALSDGALGSLLLCAGLGAVCAMPVAGAIVGKYGCRRVITVAALAAFACLPALAVANVVSLLAATLFCYGAACGTLDATMNIHAVLVERESGRALMSGFHGLWSVGGIVGAGIMSLLISMRLSPMLSATLLAAGLTVVLFASLSSLSVHSIAPSGPAFVVPRGGVLVLGCFCFALFLAEGAVLDWSAVYLTTIRHVNAGHAGWGFVAFSAAMTLCRLFGDPIVARVGGKRIVFLGTTCAAAGFVLAVIGPRPALSILGFALVGVGAANAVPVMFSAAGRQTAMPTNLAVPAITTLGYSGTLAGPALVGFASTAFGLPLALVGLAGLLIVVAMGSTRLRMI